MKSKLFMLVIIVFFISPVKIGNSSQVVKDYPTVPRISVLNAYKLYKGGKAIIIQAGGIEYKQRHLIGALDMDSEAVAKGKSKLPRLPQKGVLIITYCY